MRSLLIIVSLAAVSLMSASSLRQQPTRSNSRVIHQSWTFKDGAPEVVIALAQTSDGFLWIGSETGLVRFDGTRFEPFRSPFGDQLLSTSVKALFAPPNGGLWIGYQLGGFSLVKDGHVTNFAGDASTGSVLQFALRRDGVLWAATTSGLWTFDGSNWHKAGPEWKAPPAGQRIAPDRDGTLWVLNQGSVFALRPDSHRFDLVMQGVRAEDFTLDANQYVVTAPSKQAASQLERYPVFWRTCLRLRGWRRQYLDCQPAAVGASAEGTGGWRQ